MMFSAESPDVLENQVSCLLVDIKCASLLGDIKTIRTSSRKLTSSSEEYLVTSGHATLISEAQHKQSHHPFTILGF